MRATAAVAVAGVLAPRLSKKLTRAATNIALLRRLALAGATVIDDGHER
ncbi:hypothetical protein [Blastococcus mobilis]|nr:hypothetical protein [Blastococcus mobilis]